MATRIRLWPTRSSPHCDRGAALLYMRAAMPDVRKGHQFKIIDAEKIVAVFFMDAQGGINEGGIPSEIDDLVIFNGDFLCRLTLLLGLGLLPKTGGVP